MTLFAVSYQLNDKKDYPKLWAEMERLEGQKVMRSFWFLDLQLNFPSEVRDHLAKFVDEDDMISVVPFDQKPANKKVYKGTSDWIASRFS